MHRLLKRIGAKISRSFQKTAVLFVRLLVLAVFKPEQRQIEASLATTPPPPRSNLFHSQAVLGGIWQIIGWCTQCGKSAIRHWYACFIVTRMGGSDHSIDEHRISGLIVMFVLLHRDRCTKNVSVFLGQLIV